MRNAAPPQQSFHPLKSGRDSLGLSIGSRLFGFPSPQVGSGQPISFPAPNRSCWVSIPSSRVGTSTSPPSVLRRVSFHPLKSGRDDVSLQTTKSADSVSIPSSRVGTLEAATKAYLWVGFPSPQVGSGPKCTVRGFAKFLVSIPSSRVGTRPTRPQRRARDTFPSPQVGSGPASAGTRRGS